NAPVIARLRAHENPAAAALERQLDAVLSTAPHQSAIRARGLEAEMNDAVWTPVVVLELAALLVLLLSSANAAWLFLTRARRGAQADALVGPRGRPPSAGGGAGLIEVALIGLCALPPAVALSWLALVLTRTASTLKTPRLEEATFSSELILVAALASVAVTLL